MKLVETMDPSFGLPRNTNTNWTEIAISKEPLICDCSRLVLYHITKALPAPNICHTPESTGSRRSLFPAKATAEMFFYWNERDTHHYRRDSSLPNPPVNVVTRLIARLAQDLPSLL